MPMDCGNYANACSIRRASCWRNSAMGSGPWPSTPAAPRPHARFPISAPRAKRASSSSSAGGPSHLDLLDYKPLMKDRFNQDIPASIFGGQRITGMVAQQDRFPVAPTMYGFKQYGQSGMWLSDLLPHTGKIADQICLLRAMNTEAINHDPAITFIQTGSQLPGRPCLGSWVDYGLGSENENLPAFVVLNSLPSNGMPDQGLLSRLWGSGFLPSRYQGVQFRSAGDPVLYLSNPPGLTRDRRRSLLDGLAELNQREHQRTGDPEIETRIAQYEMAFRMQASVPDLVDTASEPEHVHALYGERGLAQTWNLRCQLSARASPRRTQCSLHSALPPRGGIIMAALRKRFRHSARDTDQPPAGFILDLKQRGMLDDTLVIWGGEFGRTPYAQGAIKPDSYGRDHHGRVFSLWMCGGGVKAGYAHGASDDYGFNVAEGGVHIHDLQATILRLLGIDHLKLTYLSQGRQFRLTDVGGQVVKEIIA